VPDYAEVYYYVRHPNAKTLAGIWDRVIKAGEAAALGTGTTMVAEVMHGNHSLLPNEALAEAMHANLSQVGGVTYNKEEQAFAETLSESLGLEQNLLGSEQEIQPMRLVHGKGSTDVGDVSWVVPTTGLRTATWVPGTASHSWQAVAAGGTSIGTKGMEVAAKTLALTMARLLQDPELIKAARSEFDRRRGANFRYEALLGDREPPLDYRN